MASTISKKAEEVQHRSRSLANTAWEHAPNYREVVGFLTIVTAGLAVAGVGGLTVAGTTIGMAVLTPVFILFSPVLIPLGTVLILIVAGLFIFGGFGLATFSLASWIYNYYKGHRPYGSDQVDAARSRLSDTASALNERARGGASALNERARGGASALNERARDTASVLNERARDYSSTVQEYLQTSAPNTLPSSTSVD